MEQTKDVVTSLRVDAFLSTILYSVLGIIIMVVSIVLINKIFDMNAKRELVEENNIAFGVMIGAVAIAIGIIIAGTISS